MSDNQLINYIIEELEKSQKVQIWNAQNEIPDEVINKIKLALQQVKDQAINDYLKKIITDKA